jgi:hypothetical protein
VNVPLQKLRRCAFELIQIRKIGDQNLRIIMLLSSVFDDFVASGLKSLFAATGHDELCAAVVKMFACLKSNACLEFQKQFNDDICHFIDFDDCRKISIV